MNYIVIKKNVKDEISFIASTNNYAKAQKIRKAFTNNISNKPYEFDDEHNQFYIVCAAINAEDYYKLKKVRFKNYD